MENKNNLNEDLKFVEDELRGAGLFKGVLVGIAMEVFAVGCLVAVGLLLSLL